ncbi:hypothetical protein IWQ56_005971, partial [Coemansia nantahalensis]
AAAAGQKHQAGAARAQGAAGKAAKEPAQDAGGRAEGHGAVGRRPDAAFGGAGAAGAGPEGEIRFCARVCPARVGVPGGAVAGGGPDPAAA